MFSYKMSYIENLHVPWNRKKDELTLVVMEVNSALESFVRVDMNRCSTQPGSLNPGP